MVIHDKINSHSRKATLEDFLDINEEYEEKGNKNKYYNNSNKERVQKNQREYGHRKRIKP